MMSVNISAPGTRGARLPGRWLIRAFTALGVGLHKLGARKNQVLVTTLGAKTGLERTVAVRRFDEPSGPILVVASLGGAASHPAWFINMAKRPESVWMSINGKRSKARPQTLEGAERAAAWQRIVTEAPNFASYQSKTDREIPVIRLTPES